MDRKDPTVRDLAKGIRHKGLLQPFLITLDQVILAGNRRRVPCQSTREEKRSRAAYPGAFGAMSDSGEDEGDGRGELSGRRRVSWLGVGEKERCTRRAKVPPSIKLRSKRIIG